MNSLMFENNNLLITPNSTRMRAISDKTENQFYFFCLIIADFFLWDSVIV